MRMVAWACARPTRFSPGCHITGLQPGCAWRFAGNSDRACSKASVFVPLCLGGLNRTWCFSALKGPGKMTVNHGATEAQREQKQREEQLSAECGPVSAKGFDAALRGAECGIPEYRSAERSCSGLSGLEVSMRPVTWACARPTRFSPGCHITGLQPGGGGNHHLEST